MRIRRVHQYRTRLVFEQAKKLWPVLIPIDDGELYGGNSAFFPSLSKAWDSAEVLAKELDEVDKLGVWGLYCCLHELARKRLKIGGCEIKISEVRMMRFDFQMRRNLVEPCWANEERLYNIANIRKRSYYFHKRDRKIFQSSFKPYYRKTVI